MLLLPAAFAHSAAQGVPPHHGGAPGLWLDWSFDPTFLLLLALAALYFRGLARHRRAGRALLPGWRPWLFALGVATFALALLSPIDALADLSFAWHMAQHMLLVLVAPPLFLLGAPFVPVVRGLPARFRRRVFVPLARQPGVRWFFINVTRPWVGLPLYVVTLWGWHHPLLYDGALHNAALHYLEHFCFVVSAVFFWWNVVSPHPFRSRLGYGPRMAYLFAAMLQNNALGALISFSTSALYAYKAMGGFWSLTAEDDQLIGGLLMWLGGAMMHVLAFTVILILLASQHERPNPARLPDAKMEKPAWPAAKAVDV